MSEWVLESARATNINPQQPGELRILWWTKIINYTDFVARVSSGMSKKLKNFHKKHKIS